MWLFSQYGFFSVVQSYDDATKVMVRARDKQHLQALQKRFRLKRHRIQHSDTRDYPYRIFIGKEAWAWIAYEISNEIDYMNFKGRLHKTNQDRFALAAHKVWETMIQHYFETGDEWRKIWLTHGDERRS